MTMRTSRRLLGCLLLGAGLAGCSGLAPVQPWEKGMLARPEMTFEADVLESKFLEHVYTSKENASGGNGVGGGGCGCN